MRIDTIFIESRMKEKLLNRNQLSHRIGTTWPNIDKLISGKTSRINFSLLGRLCAELDITPAQVFTTEKKNAQEQAEAGRRCDSGGND